MARASKMIDELGEIDLTSSSDLLEFTKRLREICRDLSWTLGYQAEVLRGQLATLPSDGRYGRLSSRVKARAVSRCLKLSAEAVEHSGKLSAKLWGLFCRYFAPQLAMAASKKKPTFKIDK